ncbi:MAG TPA: sigma-70 family RNA polymerase sigma factor [Dongiaceae bacterium]|jgi:RNA polymerase sigma factor (sigma-70 family)|nr:sigma-70 family RNA polymerase sigma factor [Dongiaceae bacterium]
MEDRELLQEYVERRSETAFAELVRRYVDLVYATALRHLGEAQAAQDVAQSVFILLARKAKFIREGNALPGWLYRATCLTAINTRRAERRRGQREEEAMNQAEIAAESSPDWEAIAPLLDEAMRRLSQTEQDAIVLRFFQDRSWREVSAALKVKEDAAQKRVSRALDKLRAHLVQRGVVASTTMIAAAIAGHAAPAAPVGLAATFTTISLATAAPGTPGLISLIMETILMKKTTCGLLVAALAAAFTIPIITAQAGPPATDTPVTADNLRQGLVLHFAFDRAEPGGKVTDRSGAGNDGQVVGAKWVAGGKQGGAFQFAPPNQYIQVPNQPSLNPSNITLAAWIRTSNRGDTWRRVFDKSYTNGYALSIGGGWTPGNAFQSKAEVEIGMQVNNYRGIVGSDKIVADGKWHHVVTTYNGLFQFLYVDGVRQREVGRWRGTVPTNAFDLTIGINRVDPNPEYGEVGASFDGLIDEPMIWNRALSEAEVVFLYQSQK